MFFLKKRNFMSVLIVLEACLSILIFNIIHNSFFYWFFTILVFVLSSILVFIFLILSVYCFSFHFNKIMKFYILILVWK